MAALQSKKQGDLEGAKNYLRMSKVSKTFNLTLIIVFAISKLIMAIYSSLIHTQIINKYNSAC